jgi:hypothetical protein
VNPIIDPWLRRVQASGAEIAVQLLVSGRRVTGFLTPYQRYDEWEFEVRRRALREGGHFVARGDLGPISPKLSKRVADEWPALQAKMDADDDGAPNGLLCAYVRDATIHEVVPMNSTRVPMLLVLAAEIAACSLGIPGEDHSPELRERERPAE